MKSKKLFAILTLVAFMMTLVPMAAFGAAGAAYSTTRSSISVKDSSVDGFIDPSTVGTTPDENTAKFTITFRDAANQVVANQQVDFAIKADKDVVQGVIDTDGDGAPDLALNSMALASDDGQMFYDGTTTVTTNSNGQVTFWVGAQVATSFKITVHSVYNGSLGPAIGSKEVTVKRAANVEIDLMVSSDEDPANAEPVDANNQVLRTYYAGVDGFALIAEYDEDEEITFKQRLNGGSWVTIGTAVTDDDGYADIWVEPTAVGTYEFKAVCGSDDSAVVKVVVTSGEPSVLEAKSAVSGKAPLKKNTLLDVYVKDDVGNLVKNSASNALFAGTPLSGNQGKIVKYQITSAPSGSDLKDDSDYLTTNNRGYARFVFNPDKVGKYVIKFTLDSPDSLIKANLGRDTLTFEYEVIEVGEVAKIVGLVTDDTYVNTVPGIRYLENGSGNPIVSGAIVPLVYNKDNAYYIDLGNANGDLTFSSSNPSAVSVDQAGQLTVVDDDFTGTVTITMTYEDDAVVSTVDVKVVGAPNALSVTPTVNGKDAQVAVQLVDKEGNATTSTSARDIAKDAIKVIAPAGVTVSGISGISSNGAGSFKLSAQEYGKYSITVVTTVDDPTKQNVFSTVPAVSKKSLSKTFEVEFVQPDSEKPVIGAKNVTMFIGAPGYTQDGVAKISDVAPFIVDGRTFVAVRPIAEAFAAEVGWNEATQTVTLSRADITVTIVIGSNTITVVKDGVTSTVTADVAAFIKDGRTVLPFRAVGEAFGATVNYDAATQAVTFQQ